MYVRVKGGGGSEEDAGVRGMCRVRGGVEGARERREGNQ